MNDRQKFETRKLANGITVYSHAMDVPFFELSVVIPFGSAHALPENPGGVPGIAHFLEHVVLNRSELHPGKDEFTRELSLKGGYVNASTGPYQTRIYSTAPVAIQEEAVKGLFSHVWHPILDNEEDLEIERTIVGNERNQRKYFPGNSELSKYLYTEWMLDNPLSKTQVFGTDDDLAAMTPANLKAFHDLYFTDKTCVVVGGGHDLEPIIEELEKIATRSVAPKEKIVPAEWIQKDYHTHTFKDLDAPAYYLGGIFPEYDFETSHAIGFILELLTNNVHGPLYTWTRNDKGWTYGISDSSWSDPDRMGWYIKLPLNHAEPIKEVRTEIHARMQAAVEDTDLVQKEVDRRAYNDLYNFQTLDSRIGQALWSLRQNGRILSEQEYKDLNKKMLDTGLLKEVYQKYLSPDVSGELFALPESVD